MIPHADVELTPGVFIEAATLDRLWGRVEKSEGCWLWPGCRRNGRHGAISVHDAPVYVHRLSFAQHFGPIPPGVQILHKCDTRNCVRPDHLIAGSDVDRCALTKARGRASTPPRLLGLRNVNAWLSDEAVAEIRAEWASGNWKQRDIAAKHGCSQSTVWRLVHGVVRAERAA